MKLLLTGFYFCFGLCCFVYLFVSVAIRLVALLKEKILCRLEVVAAVAILYFDQRSYSLFFIFQDFYIGSLFFLLSSIYFVYRFTFPQRIAKYLNISVTFVYVLRVLSPIPSPYFRSSSRYFPAFPEVFNQDNAPPLNSPSHQTPPAETSYFSHFRPFSSRLPRADCRLFVCFVRPLFRRSSRSLRGDRPPRTRCGWVKLFLLFLFLVLCCLFMGEREGDV